MSILSAQSTYKYTISLLFCLIINLLQAQTEKKQPEKDNVKLFNSFTVQADLASIVISSIGGDSYSMEGGIQVDLKHKYYPIVELGLAGANKTSNDNIGFKTNALFGRLGVDINLLSTKKDSKPTNNLFLAGLRIGMTNFEYDITNVVITDDYWGGSEIVIYNKIPASKIWYEIIAGVRVEVYKNIFMGWTIRNKNLISQDVSGAASPWYIPGYGLNTSTNWGINYTLGYKF
jgi:hypothetical protein